tara:strand:+ start:157 stop:357 length:201 start_codon:yes stop_codon:yes gene_type:complete
VQGTLAPLRFYEMHFENFTDSFSSTLGTPIFKVWRGFDFFNFVKRHHRMAVMARQQIADLGARYEI